MSNKVKIKQIPKGSEPTKRLPKIKTRPIIPVDKDKRITFRNRTLPNRDTIGGVNKKINNQKVNTQPNVQK
jgi:hypothetical protein